MSDKIEMPDDWDDHGGWETYYAALPSEDYRSRFQSEYDKGQHSVVEQTKHAQVIYSPR